MYLKRIELHGFKSFAEPTAIEFGPGMTAIVGPNGCGKSNIVDAVRWVLGEQSVKSLRGEKMEDCIFKGTERRKPMGMAEVSLTFADCEDVLGLEFNEVTITRRVLRSGEGQYFINRTPCRLKDIQRLFMDTGIGYNSYAILEQGRIDQILSARPDDRRAAFEEASGITRYKADKREAVRKLQRVEENLLRVADIIREVKRQMISLQRQAGKARRYQELHRRLRSLDLWLGRRQLEHLNSELRKLELQRARLGEQIEAHKAELAAREAEAENLRREMGNLERILSERMTQAVRNQAQIENARRTIQMCRERMEELRRLADRDRRDAEMAQRHRDEMREKLAGLRRLLSEREGRKVEADTAYRREAERLAAVEKGLVALQEEMRSLRDERVDLESRAAQLHNAIMELDASERNRVLRHERLQAEKVETRRALASLEREVETLEREMAAAREELARRDQQLGEVRSRLQSIEAEIASLREERARQESARQALEARLEALGVASSRSAETQRAVEERLAGGKQEGGLLGVLDDLLEAEEPYRTALDAVLHFWADALVVESESKARALAEAVDRDPVGPLRIVAARGELVCETAVPDGAGEPLVSHVTYPAEVSDLVMRMIGRVRVVESLQDVPYPVLNDIVYVTQDGIVVRPGGSFEIWLPVEDRSDAAACRQLQRKLERELQQCKEVIADYDARLSLLQAERERVLSDVAQQEEAVAAARHELALTEGEHKVVTEQAVEARKRCETVEFELASMQMGAEEDERKRLREEQDECGRRQGAIQKRIEELSREIREMEEQRSTIVAELTKRRLEAAEAEVALRNVAAEIKRLERQVEEMEQRLSGRGLDARQRDERLVSLQAEAAEATTLISRLEAELRDGELEIAQLKENRRGQEAALQRIHEDIQQRRSSLESLSSSVASLEVRITEVRMQRDSLRERLRGEYHADEAEILAAPAPEGKDGGILSSEAAEAEIAEIRARLDSIGPVNLVALEEVEELKKRYEFLTTQQQDLVNSRKQLMELINRINRVTRDKFLSTFEQVDRNFRQLFKNLFGGGHAKLLLVDEQDVLESGVEIIASPPGKKLQSISLLSGGERTLAAVALLFALYQVRRSPFCLLDELDAALDDANIQRFINVLRGFLQNAQFIVISHNRRTVSEADTLYGITMEEDGVSRVISVKLADVAAPALS